MCHHLVAFAHLGHTGSDGDDRPGRLCPERHRSRAADLPAADPDELVPVADAGCGDVDQDLAFGRRRRLVHLEDLTGLAACPDPGNSHLKGGQPVRATSTSSTTLPRFPRAATRSNAAEASASGKTESTST